jgi:putative endonuclease
MKTTVQGNLAEEAVADYLNKSGWKILERNWKNKLCEIDIIVKKAKIIYFIEVKFRQNDYQGDGLEYITPKKLKQLNLGANYWSFENNWTGDFRLLAASVGLESDEIKIQELIEVS